MKVTGEDYSGGLRICKGNIIARPLIAVEKGILFIKSKIVKK